MFLGSIFSVVGPLSKSYGVYSLEIQFSEVVLMVIIASKFVQQGRGVACQEDL